MHTMHLSTPHHCRHLNELRQATSLADAASHAPTLKTGRMLYSEGVAWMCKAVACDLDDPLSADDAALVLDFYRSRGATPCIELTDHSSEESLAHLAEAGFSLRKIEHVFSHTLDTLPRPAAPAGLTLQRVESGAVRELAAVMVAGFLPEGAPLPAPMVAAVARTLRHPDAQGFLATVGDVVAGACGMEVARIPPQTGAAPVPVAALWGAVVRPAFRRRGVQQAMMAHRLREAARAGAALAVIESTPGIPTARNAARLGFSLSYLRLVLKA